MSSSNGKYPPTEVQPRASRRTFTAAYKRQIVEEATQCGHGEIGALLRREGLYSSLLSEWRKQAAAGAVEGLARKRGRPGPDAKDRKIAALEAENERLRKKLETSEKVIEVQGKVSALLEHLSESADTKPRSKP